MPKKEGYLTPEEIRKLIDSAPTVRDRIVLKLFARTAISRLELKNLEVKDINFEKRLITVKGKYERARTIPVDKDTLNDILIYLGARKEGKLIQTQKASSISLKEINMITKRAGLIAKIKNPQPGYKFINPQLFRYSFVVNSLKAGIPLEIIQQIVGYSSVKKILDALRKPSLKEIQEIYDKLMSHENK